MKNIVPFKFLNDQIVTMEPEEVPTIDYNAKRWELFVFSLLY